MTDIVEALALRARKILQVQKESGEVINRESIARIVDLDAQTFTLMTRKAVKLRKRSYHSCLTVSRTVWE